MTPRKMIQDDANPGLHHGCEPGFVVVGKLRRAHGVRGEMVMEVLTDFPERLVPQKVVYLGDSHQPIKLRTVRNHDRYLLVSFEGLYDPDAVGAFRNELVCVRIDHLPELPQGQYYHHQLIGLVVLDETDCMVDIARYFLSFTQNQSCGRCTFCRIGTTRMLQILTKICIGEGKMSDLDLLEETEKRIKAAESRIRAVCRQDEICRLLSSIPGIGDILAVTIRYEIDNIERFISSGKLCSYAGLVPSTYSSGSRTYQGRITKQGNKWLRWALIEAAQRAPLSDMWLKAFYARVSKKGKKIARVAVARKLLEIIYRVWTERRPYYKKPVTAAL